MEFVDKTASPWVLANEMIAKLGVFQIVDARLADWCGIQACVTEVIT